MNQAIASELLKVAESLTAKEPDTKDLEDWFLSLEPVMPGGLPLKRVRGRWLTDEEVLWRFWRDKGSPDITLSTPQQRKIKNKNILKFFSFQRSYEDRIYDYFSNSQFEAFIKILKKVYKDTPISFGSGSEDYRPGDKVFRSNMVKWRASYYHDGGLMDIEPNSDSDFSKLRSMV